MLKGMFHKQPDVKEQMRESKAEMRRGTRELDREILALKREETKLIAEIKQAAKAGNTPATRVLAKSLVRVRAQVGKLQASSAQLRGIGSSMTTAAATATVAKAMQSASATMASVQQATDPAKMAKQVQQFSKENAKMEMAQEMVGDAMDDAFDNEETEAETDELVGQVLDEIGIDLVTGLRSAPKNRVANAAQQQATVEEPDPLDDLNTRLAHLKS